MKWKWKLWRRKYGNEENDNEKVINNRIIIIMMKKWKVMAMTAWTKIMKMKNENKW